MLMPSANCAWRAPVSGGTVALLVSSHPECLRGRLSHERCQSEIFKLKRHRFMGESTKLGTRHTILPITGIGMSNDC